jgi:phosphatidylserine decarboxylase
MKIAVEGFPFVLVALALSGLGFFLGWALIAFAGAAIGIFLIWFFRDPERHAPQAKALVVAPADGKIVGLAKSDNAPLLAGDQTRISIFMSPFDVHINRMPVAGTIEDVCHRQGRFLAAYRDEAVEQNEQNAMRIADVEGRKVGVVQVAGFLARRVVCKARKGDTMNRGERFGLIMFGSRTDLYLPPDAEITVVEGQKVKGGETVIGRFK